MKRTNGGMTMTKIKEKEKYVDLILQKGVNLQKNQALFINAPIEGADFIRKVDKKAYELGAKDVHINWADDELSLLKYKNATDEVIENYPEWRVKMQEAYAEDGAAFLSVLATDPDLLQHIPGERVAAANKAAGTALVNFRKKMRSEERRVGKEGRSRWDGVE